MRESNTPKKEMIPTYVGIALMIVGGSAVAWGSVATFGVLFGLGALIVTMASIYRMRS